MYPQNSRTPTQESFVATGWVVWHHTPYAIQIDSPLLVMDTFSFAQSLKTFFEENALRFGEEALHCEDPTEAEALTEDFEAFASTAEEITAWLEKPEGRVNSVWPLAMRQNITPLKVERHNLAIYMNKLFFLAKPADERVKPDFLFIADGPQPVLYATNKLKAIARHTGNEILGVSVNEDALYEDINRALQRRVSYRKDRGDLVDPLIIRQLTEHKEQKAIALVHA